MTMLNETISSNLKKGTTVKIATHLYLHLDIDYDSRLRAKFNNKKDDFRSISFLFRKIPTAPACRVYTSQLVWYSNSCISYRDS